MIDELNLTNWPGGANNRAPADRVPEGFVRDLVNLHPIGGTLTARPGAARVVACTNLRGAHPVSGGLLIVDGPNLLAVDQSYAATPVASVPPFGACAFVDMNGVTYASIGSAVFTYSSAGVSNWGVPTPTGVVSDVPESTRKVAATFVSPTGIEGGASPFTPLGGTVTLPTPPSGWTVAVYASAEDGEEMYHLFDSSVGGTFPVGPTDEEAPVLTTQHLAQPPPADILAVHEGRIFGASGNVVYYTLPMQPHHTDPVECFLYYPAPVTSMAAGDGGLYVGADKLYAISFRGGAPEQRVVSQYPPMHGGMRSLEDGGVVAMTKKGVLIERSDERGGFFLDPATELAYTVENHERAAIGEIDYEGEKVIVSSVSDRVPEGNGLKTSDFFETEVIRP